MQELFPTHPVPFYRGPVELAFGIQPVMVEGNTARAAMCLGPWALREDGSGVHQGATGVLVDDVTAYAVLTARGDDQWGVSSQISVDFHSPIRADMRQIVCTAQVDHVAGDWGFSSGRVVADSGELIATIGQRVKFFPSDESPHRTAGLPADATTWLTSLDSHLELIRQDGTHREFLLRADPGMRNVLGTLHGGVSLAFSELAARRAAESSGGSSPEKFLPASIRMSYLRPGIVDGNPRITAEVIHRSRTVATVETHILNPDGKAATHGVVTLHKVQGA
ncbi:hotdog domain-containing protein [Corynebacterium comes]|uniref:Thioesterase superfamily protein n=1 Tax=Corynebacterium comes TaxID=2675218 RepID=A0A6B8VK65_9CORY|nr:PaaI family thioesterase [Corynebacterium comes]QGU03459.1 Thioesterase superfamily protein [Corynebacterium comes]